MERFPHQRRGLLCLVGESWALSQPIEQAAYPTFVIIVGDVHKVEDLTSAHIVYSVRTKVGFLEHLDKVWQSSHNVQCVRVGIDSAQSLQAAGIYSHPEVIEISSGCTTS